MSLINAHLKKKLSIHIGMQVPGPLHKIKSGLILNNKGMLYNIDITVVTMEVKYDCPTDLLLGILTIK